MGDTPLSVVIAAHNAAGVIGECLLALEQQSGSPSFEVIVADSSSDATPVITRERFPWVRLLHFDEPLTVPELRGQGVAAARGAVIAILDPFSVTAPDWASNVLNAHARHDHSVIGGSIDLYQSGSASYASWSLYLHEYGLFMSPTVRGSTWILPGTNLSYKRTALFDGGTPRYPVFWKTRVNWAIQSGGAPLWIEPDIRVETNKPIPFAEFLRTRYHHGRCFAGTRAATESVMHRATRTASAPVVPLLLLWRLTIGIWPKGRRRWRFASTLPAQFALFTVWAWGEACGYLRGTGSSCGHIYY